MKERKKSLHFLEKSNLPFLFIIGKEDNAIPFLTSMQQCHLPKISYIHLLKNVGHMGMLEMPIAFNDLVKKYLKEVN
jgi:pimeloyl-ACP methyl ester carboxylesterase